jgi:hypothetical protein
MLFDEVQRREFGGMAARLRGHWGLQLHSLDVSTERNMDMAFAALAKFRAGGLVIGGDVFFRSRTEQLGLVPSGGRLYRPAGF